MKLKYIALAGALLLASQSWALTAEQRNHGCNTEGEGCGSWTLGGGGGYGVAEASGAFIDDGILYEFYSDRGDSGQGGGFWWIETNLNTKQQTVHQDSKAAFLVKPAPYGSQDKSNLKRSNLVHGAMSPGMSYEQAQAKKAQAEAAAKKAAAEKKAAADKKAAEERAAIAKAGGIGVISSGLSGPVSSKPAGMGNAPVIASTPAGTGVAAGSTTAVVPVGNLNARKKP